MRRLPLLVLALAAWACAQAQSYPSRPVRMVVGESPAARARLAEAGADGSVTRSPEEFAAIVRADTARYAKIIKDAGLRID